MYRTNYPEYRPRRLLPTALAAAVLAVAAPDAIAATISVNTADDASAGGDGNCSLREAIAAANTNDAAGSGCVAGNDNDDTIVFVEAVANSAITLSQGALPTISGALTVTGPVTIDANEQSRIFVNQSNLVLNDLTLINGTTASGGDDSADDRSGGAVLNDNGGVLAVNGGAMNNNTSDRAGGAIEEASGGMPGTVAVTLNGVDFSGNDGGATPGNGGVLHVTGTTDIAVTGGTFDNNTAVEGGALWNNAGTMTIADATFTNNTVTGGSADDGDADAQGGGALFANTADGVMDVSNSVFDANSADGDISSGGAIFVNEGAVLRLFGSRLANNSANRAGGAIELRNDATATVSGTDMVMNIANPTAGGGGGNGGAIHVTGSADITLTGGVYANNSAVEGGALWNNQGEMTLDGVSVVGNEATGADATQGGGGIYAEAEASEGTDSGTLTINNSRIAGNTASGTAGSGGGILVSPGATVNIADSRIEGNSANRAGGGIENAGGTLTLTRVTLGGSSAGFANDAGDNPGNGGGLHIGGAGTASVSRSSVGYNTAVEGGGLWNSGAGTLDVDTSTVAFNSASGTGGGLYLDDAGGTITADFATVTNNTGGGIVAPNGGTVTIADSLIAENDTNLGDGVTASADDGNTVTGDASLDGYKLSGGPTATQPLTMGSAALDTNADCGDDDDNSDQRGAERPFDAVDGDAGDCDSGAYELTDAPVITVTMNGPDNVAPDADDDTAVSVLGFTLANSSDDTVTVGGFSGAIERDRALPAGSALSQADLTVYQDANANGVFDMGESQVASANVADNGAMFTVDFGDGAGVAISGNDSASFVVTTSLGDDADTMASLSRTLPLYAGGALLGLLGLISVGGGLRRRIQLTLIVAAIALTLTACSDDDRMVDLGDGNGNGGNGMNGGDMNIAPLEAGQLRFVLQTLDTTGNADDTGVIVGYGLPVRGPIVTVPAENASDSDTDANNEMDSDG